MTSLIRLLLIVQIALFAFAASAHFELFGDRNDPAAGTAESVIATVLLAGMLTGVANPAMTRTTALVAQGFALLGTLVGFTLVLTVGPTTAFDVTMHLSMLVALIIGLGVTIRAPRTSGTLSPAHG